MSNARRRSPFRHRTRRADITGTVLNVDGGWLAYGGTEPPPD
ncbi:hypothetical protein [Burkholderia sp. PU8-34]